MMEAAVKSPTGVEAQQQGACTVTPINSEVPDCYLDFCLAGVWAMAGDCGGCDCEIKNGQSLVALDKHWHLTCFKCKICGKVLNAEYISKDGVPYCEMDYHVKFGIRCDNCEKYIMGRILEAGEKHYHPTCARCIKCHQMFTEGEEMYLQGPELLLVWLDQENTFHFWGSPQQEGGYPPDALHQIKPQKSFKVDFNGNPDELAFFLIQVGSYMEVHSDAFHTDRERVFEVGTQLCGEAANWLFGLVEEDSPEMYDLEQFLLALRRWFEDPLAEEKARGDLQRLRQVQSFGE
uniref:Uncharacterized protein n=1 Tax=Sphaerodactylus townsendi TaxID=933632 RepID=A0ACB8E7B8_9SAUR